MVNLDGITGAHLKVCATDLQRYLKRQYAFVSGGGG